MCRRLVHLNVDPKVIEQVRDVVRQSPRGVTVEGIAQEVKRGKADVEKAVRVLRRERKVSCRGKEGSKIYPHPSC